MEKSTLVIAAVFIFIGSKQWMKSFERLSLTDDLTQIPNRRLSRQMVNNEISKCVKEKHVLTLAIIDIDYFKNINDEYGHNADDKILKSFAEFLKKSIKITDNVGRWGGEEFIILMKNTQIDQAKEIMEDLCEQVQKQSFNKNNEEQSFTVSIGLSQWQSNSDDFENLFIKADKADKADKALYRAKDMEETKLNIK